MPPRHQTWTRFIPLLVVTLSHSVTHSSALPTEFRLFPNGINLGNILESLQHALVGSSAQANVTASSEPANAAMALTSINEFDEPSLTEYPNGGVGIIYSVGKPTPLVVTDPSSSSLLQEAVSEDNPSLTNADQAQPTSSADLFRSTADVTSLTDAVVAAYYADWAVDQLAPENVDFTRFNWIDFAFAIPNEKFELEFTQSNSEDVLRRLVSSAHGQGRKVKLSIGGWTGSRFFSRGVRTIPARSTFVKSILHTYEKFELDGIDIDWEYPNGDGAGNEKSSKDTANFLKFLQLLRKLLPNEATLTAAVALTPFAGSDGQPLSDVREFASVLDWVVIMNYDVWGSSSSPGPNAPLSDGCGRSRMPFANAQGGIQKWVDAGMPHQKIVLGVPSYGVISRSGAQRLESRDKDKPSVDVDDDQESRDGIRYRDNRRGISAGEEDAPLSLSVGITMGMLARNQPDGQTSRGKRGEVANADGGDDQGQIGFHSLVRQGLLVRNNGGDYEAAGGFERRWDTCSSTPWLRGEAGGQIVSYDDPVSMRLKGELVNRMGLLGINMFAAHGDDGWALVDGARRGMGVGM